MKRCALCGTEFKPYRPYQKYCGRECYMEAKRRCSRKGIIPNPKKCEICGAEFKPYRPNQRYCSRAECKREGLRRWQRANRKAVNLQSVKKCEICGTEFKPYRPNQRYCSRAECKREGIRRWRRANRKALKLCEEFHDLGKPLSIAEARELVK